MYEIVLTKTFIRIFSSYEKRNNKISLIVDMVFSEMSINPFSLNLRTHKVISRQFGTVYSSRLTGDLRLLWVFRNNQQLILALTIGGHSGGKKVYK